MSDEFTNRRHANPDWELDLHVTGVKKGTTGVDNWFISCQQNYDPEYLLQLLERICDVLRDGEHI